ncbi:hypothetical protein MHBO_004630, partial [Bonamia ostreae]
CFSLGGVIARSALIDMLLRPFLPKMHTFMSLSVCHLGYLCNTNTLFKYIFWAVRKGTKSTCLKQLSLEDHSDKRKAFLYKLSLNKTLSNFKNVLIFSSKEDLYVPQHSARIETINNVSNNNIIHNEMTANLLNPLSKVLIVKINVKFDKEQSMLDKMTGRDSHISFISNENFIRDLFFSYGKYFWNDCL